MYETRSENHEYFSNPSWKELSDLVDMNWDHLRYFRFIADPKNQKIYVWSLGHVHWTAYKILGLDYELRFDKYFNGLAEWDEMQRRWVMVSSDIHNPLSSSTGWIYKIDWSWMIPYVDVSDWIKRNTAIHIRTYPLKFEP